MSTTAIEKVVSELQSLPESDHELFLSLVRDLKQKRAIKSTPYQRLGYNPAVQLKNGHLVFTGRLLEPEVDWLRVVREEREAEISRQALGLPASQ